MRDYKMLKEKGRKFFPVLCFALWSFSEGGSSAPLLPGPFFNKKEVYPCEDNNFP